MDGKHMYIKGSPPPGFPVDGWADAMITLSVYCYSNPYFRICPQHVYNFSTSESYGYEIEFTESDDSILAIPKVVDRRVYKSEYALVKSYLISKYTSSMIHLDNKVNLIEDLGLSRIDQIRGRLFLIFNGLRMN